MLDASEEHSKVFKEQLLAVFRRASSLKDSLVRAKLPKSQTGSVKGCFKCGKSRCQFCSCMQYSISSSFKCDSSGVVYFLGCKVCGTQYVGSTFTSLRTRFNHYMSSSRKFSNRQNFLDILLKLTITDSWTM